MSRYNILQAIYMSFYSKALYRDVAKTWGAKTFLYLLLIVCLSWIGLTLQLQYGLNLAYQANSEAFISQVPILNIKDGKVSTPESRPYIIKAIGSEDRIAVIDTTGTYTNLEQAKAGVLLTNNALITQSQQNEIKTYQIPSTTNMTIDPKVINSYIEKYLGYLWIIFFIIFVLGGYLYRVIQALIYAIFGKIMAGMASVPLIYDEILRIAMVAVTPAIIIATLFDFFAISYPWQFTSYFILTMIYLFFGIQANKGASTIPPEKQVIATGESEHTSTSGSQLKD